ncbi:Uncharacterised protein [Shigella sonnei]|nr:Uncharacterised protein [Shigella sonnei]CSF37863.1 Uncharacterised protein [Shigella sonnei]CSF61301.1 Uncharacterised protein [Shigella sonnei]CSF68297.1 Uncharacterised protein [Shigella sonnei]CSG29660.1 Uncharacterised protein [Shigella sonnei]
MVEIKRVPGFAQHGKGIAFLDSLRLHTKGEQSDKQQQYAHNHLQWISFYSSLAAIRHAFTMNNKGRKHTLPLRRIRFLQPADKIVQR